MNFLTFSNFLRNVWWISCQSFLKSYLYLSWVSISHCFVEVENLRRHVSQFTNVANYSENYCWKLRWNIRLRLSFLWRNNSITRYRSDYLFMMERFVLNTIWKRSLYISEKTDQMTHLAHSVRIFSFSLSFLRKFIKNSSNQGVD